MPESKDNFVGGIVVGGLAGSTLTALLTAKPVAAAPDTAKLDYITNVVQQIAAGQVAMGEAIASIPQIQLGVEVTDRLDKIIESLDKEFLFSPEKMCAVLWLNFPNLVYPVILAFSITLAPGATVEFATTVPSGFVEVLVKSVKLAVDVDFILSYIQLYDNGKIIAQDPAVTNYEISISEWFPVLTNWQAFITNNSAFFNCTLHSWSVTYEIESHLFNYVKDKLKKLGQSIITEEVFK